MQEVLLVAVLTLAWLVGCLFKIQNRWIEAQKAHLRDQLQPATPELIYTWKKMARNADTPDAEYESYRQHLLRAGEADVGDRHSR
jgi:hypothetical protein